MRRPLPDKVGRHKLRVKVPRPELDHARPRVRLHDAMFGCRLVTGLAVDHEISVHDDMILFQMVPLSLCKTLLMKS